MAAVSQKTLNWLYSVLTADYRDVNRTYEDVGPVLSSYSSLLPRTEVYTFENGSSALLLQLSGTIPVSFRGSTYRFPITIWVPHQYPREPPMAYVVPSQGMIVRPGQHISGEGRVYHPYLANWEKFWDRSNLQDFLAILRDVFSKEPPLVAQYSDNSQSLPQIQSPPPVPPLPHELEQSLPGSQRPRDSYTSQQPPLPPPKPYAASPTYHSPSSSIPSSQPYNNQAYENPSAGFAPSQQASQSRHENSLDYTSNGHSIRTVNTYLPRSDSYRGQSESNTTPGHSITYSPVSPIFPQGVQHGYQEDWRQHHSSFPPRQSERATSIQTKEGQGLYDYRTPSANSQPIAQLVTNSRAIPKVIPNLLDTPADFILHQPSHLPVPPVPPNPEKDQLLHSLGVALFQQRQASDAKTKSSLELLEAQYNALSNAALKIQEETEAIKGTSASLISNEKILKDSMKKADQVIADAQQRAVPRVDEVLVAPTTVATQLYDLVAEEHAIEDAIFILARAMDKGRINTDVFLKNTRSLAREQFLKKALIKSISNGMGLENGY